MGQRLSFRAANGLLEELMAYVAKQYRNESCYPNPEAIFKAFELTPLGQVKVVILVKIPITVQDRPMG